jgi:transcriptional regulator with XRE-family HTH domain
MLMSVFGERIAKLREDRGIKQAEAARRMKDFVSSAQVLSGYELGKRQPPFETVVAFAQYYGVTTDYLLGNSDEERPQVKNLCNETMLSRVAVTNLLKMSDHPDMGGDPNCLFALNNLLEGFSDILCAALVPLTEFLEFEPVDCSAFEDVAKSANMDPERFAKLTNDAIEQQIINDFVEDIKNLRMRYYWNK